MNRDYQDPEYKKWRKKIYSRDKYSCQWPGCTGKTKLEAHHILRWKDFPGLRYEQTNGITLCRNHHRLVTGNEEHYIKFLSGLLGKKT